VDNKLVGLEKNPNDKGLLNDIFRGFHTIKGGAGFLNAAELVTLCHLTENLFDLLRNGQIAITPVVMDSIMDATGTVRDMFGSLEQGMQPGPASPQLLENLRAAIAGETKPAAAPVVAAAPAAAPTGGPDWAALHGAVASEAATITEPQAAPVVLHTDVAGKSPEQIIQQAMGRRATDTPGSQNVGGRREVEKSGGGGGTSRSGGGDNSIRVDTTRLDQVLNLSGEIGLTKNRLNSLRSDILNGRNDSDTLHALDQAVSQLDLLVSDLQNAVMKTRMQPIGRLFQKYPRIARDLARNLGKDVELVLVGEETEIDKTMIEDLSDPIIHLIRNAVDHGIEPTADRLAAGKSPKSEVRLEARQEGDHILLLISDDGRGMNPEKLRAKAVEKGLITDEEANVMDERQSYNLVFLPGFSTKDAITDVSGRGVGMDVVKTNIQKLNGSIETKSALGKGTTFIISLPLTLAILPVLLVQLDQQPFAVPLSMVREILPINVIEVQEVGGRATMVVRGEVMPIYPLNYMLGWASNRTPGYGVLMQTAEQTFILAIDGFMGREDAVIKSLEDFRPKGVAGVTTLSNGQIVLILDIKELLSDLGDGRGVPRSVFQAAISAAA
jgi:two-component system chemotaxis sensor kinase CheA